MTTQFLGDIPILANVLDTQDLPPRMWITDGVMERATWDTVRHLPGQEEEPFRRQGEPWITVVRVATGEGPETYINWSIQIQAPLFKGETRPRKASYVLTEARREEMKLSLMRWAD